MHISNDQIILQFGIAEGKIAKHVKLIEMISRAFIVSNRGAISTPDVVGALRAWPKTLSKGGEFFAQFLARIAKIYKTKKIAVERDATSTTDVIGLLKAWSNLCPKSSLLSFLPRSPKFGKQKGNSGNFSRGLSQKRWSGLLPLPPF